jgi:hypothetical protein
MSEPTRPALSPAAVEQYREILARPNFERDFPERHAALKASLDAAASVTGQSFAPAAPKLPTPAEHHAKTYGIPTASSRYTIDLNGVALPEGADPDKIAKDGAAFAAAVHLPAYLAGPVIRDMAATAKVDPEAVARQLGETAYAEAIKDVDALLKMGGSKKKAVDLSAYSLSQLAIYARHQARMLKTQPKG